MEISVKIVEADSRAAALVPSFPEGTWARVSRLSACDDLRVVPWERQHISVLLLREDVISADALVEG